MTLQSSGAISMSQIRSEFGGGSGAISFADFYRGAASGKVRAKQSNNTATNLAASVPTSGAIAFSNFHGQARAFRKTYSSGATNQNAADVFGNDWGVNYPKEIIINSGVELGATTTSEEALEISSGLSGGLTVTNNGTLSGAGGSAGGGAGGDAFEANSACTLINNGTIRAGGGGGGNGGNGGTGGSGGTGRFTTTSTNSLGVTLHGPNGLDVQPITTSQTGNINFRVSFNFPSPSSVANYISTRPGGLNYSIQLSGGASHNPGGGTFGRSGYAMERGSRTYTGGGSGIVRYTYTGTNIGPFNIAVWGGGGTPNNNFVMDYNSSTYTVTNTHYTAGGAGGGGGGGGAGGRGQGYNHGNQNGSGGSAGAGGAGGGTNAGAGGQGGTGGTGGNGGTYGNGGGGGATGATGNNGASGNHSGGGAGSAGSGGSGGGAAGKYIRGLSNVTFTNNGTVQGGTA